MIKRFVCALVMVTVAILSVPELKAASPCQIQAYKNYRDDQQDCGYQLGSSVALCHLSLLNPPVFLLCQGAAVGWAAYCMHRAEMQYRDTMEACQQESGHP